MKKTSVFIRLLACALCCAMLFSFTAAAAPAPEGARVCKSHPGPLLTLSELAKTAAARNRGPMRAPGLQPAVSDLPLAVIVVGFNDLPYSPAYNWAEHVFGGGRSLAEFYTDMSLGQFTFTPVRETSAFGGANKNTADAANDGVIHVSLERPHDDWTLSYPFYSKKDIATNRTLSEAMIAALEAADAYLDFSAYDTDGSGAITTDELALGFIFAGYEASASDGYGLGKSRYLWSHASTLQDTKDEYSFAYDLPAPDGVTVNSYIVISEQEETGARASIATLAHELGHYIGLPDLYDTTYDTTAEWGKYDVSCMSLMCMDCWADAETGEWLPTPLDAWSRTVLGWVTPAAADASGVYTLTAQTDAHPSGCGVLKIPTPNPEEYYLLETRAPSGWDAPMANEYGDDACGVVLWHIDDGVYDRYCDENAVNDSYHRPAVMPLYPEKSTGKDLTFIGKNSTVYTGAPFFDRAGWNTQYQHLGAALDLPVYGRGENADKRASRTLSGIKIEFLTDAGSEMRLAVDLDGHAHNPAQTVLQAPTCTEAGIAAFACPVCGAFFTDETGAARADGPVAVPALGHTAPDAAGNCARCGASLVSSEQLCPYCHKYHNASFFQRLIAFFHRILFAVARLFGTR